MLEYENIPHSPYRRNLLLASAILMLECVCTERLYEHTYLYNDYTQLYNDYTQLYNDYTQLYNDYTQLYNDYTLTDSMLRLAKIRANRSDRVPVVKWYKSAVENR
jgi:hypothetical protein